MLIYKVGHRVKRASLILEVGLLALLELTLILPETAILNHLAVTLFVLKL